MRKDSMGGLLHLLDIR